MKLKEATKKIESVIQNIEKVIIGKRESIELSLVALLSNGHLLIEDIPGVGKTTLAKAIATCINCKFQRIQFTPDLLPSDILGVNVYNQKIQEFVFKAGPIFANIVLADEINRASPRTQSSLLEAMSEYQVSIDGITHRLPQPFLVIATQNPIEYEGTFPLPESQLDRFALSITMGYLNIDEEKKMVLNQRFYHPLEKLEPVIDREELIEIQELIKEVAIEDSLLEYIVRIVAETRKNEKIKLGSSPRGSLMLYRACQALALINNRSFAIPDDVKKLAVPVLSHRIILKPNYKFSGVKNSDVIREILDLTPVPR